MSDNRGALHLASNSNYSNRSKHIAVRFAALRDWIKDELLIVDHVSSSNQQSDNTHKNLRSTNIQFAMRQDTQILIGRTYDIFYQYNS